MAKRYSLLTFVVLVGAFALLGYMGARLSQQALLQKTAGPPPAVHLADRKKTVAPSERDGKMLAARTPADAAKSAPEPANATADTRLAPPLLSNERADEGTMDYPAVPQSAQPTPAVMPLNQASAAGDSRQTGPGKADMLSNRADTRSHARQARFAARAAATRQPALGGADMPVETSRAKHTRTHQSRHRDVVETRGSRTRSHDRRYAARGDIPAPPAPGFRLLPFLPIFLHF